MVSADCPSFSVTCQLCKGVKTHTPFGTLPRGICLRCIKLSKQPLPKKGPQECSTSLSITIPLQDVSNSNLPNQRQHEEDTTQSNKQTKSEIQEEWRQRLHKGGVFSFLDLAQIRPPPVQPLLSTAPPPLVHPCMPAVAPPLAVSRISLSDCDGRRPVLQSNDGETQNVGVAVPRSNILDSSVLPKFISENVSMSYMKEMIQKHLENLPERRLDENRQLNVINCYADKWLTLTPRQQIPYKQEDLMSLLNIFKNAARSGHSVEGSKEKECAQKNPMATCEDRNPKVIKRERHKFNSCESTNIFSKGFQTTLQKGETGAQTVSPSSSQISLQHILQTNLFQPQHKIHDQIQPFHIQNQKTYTLRSQNGANSKFTSRKRRRSLKQQFPCDFCGKVFSRNHHLKTHKLIHTGEKPFSCDICHRKFNQNGSLKRHQRLHTGEKQFPCEHCGKKLTQHTFLAHQQLHMRSDENAYTCALCGKTFDDSEDMKMHMLRHAEYDKKNYWCDICNKLFSQKSSLTIHKRIHSGVKPYTCDEIGCGKGFVRKDHLKLHSRVHSGEKPYSCHQCKKNFSRKCNLKAHLRIHEE